jgi:hypothetical protein
MSLGHRAAGHRVRWSLLGALAALAAAVALALPTSGAGDPAAEPLVVQPVVGVGDLDMVLMGASPGEAPNETWAYRRLPTDVPSVRVAGRDLSFGAALGSGSAPDPQLAFLRYQDGSGWQVSDLPIDESGRAYRGGLPNPISARMTPNGAGLVITRDSARSGSNQLVLLARNPGGPFQAVANPPAPVLKPADASNPEEALAADRGVGTVVDTAFDENGKLGAFFAPIGRDLQDGIVHYDGSNPGSPWTREAICTTSAPNPCTPPATGSFHVLALSATSTDNAWMLAQPDDTSRGVVLYQRQREGADAVWRERSLGAPLFESADTPAQEVTEVRALTENAESLTATSNGVWIDGSLKTGPSATATLYDFTLYFDVSAGKITGSWCDAPRPGGGSLCDRPFGATFSRRDGYRSFAWAGAGFGSRVVTNPLDSTRDDDSNRGSFLRFNGQDFARQPGTGPNRQRSGAFSSPDEGWLGGPVHVTRSPDAGRLGRWPVALRAPLTSVVGEPGKSPGDLASGALAVGSNGAVARYAPGQGWQPEFLLSQAGTVVKANLRGVAWPEPGRAYAVGDLGQMWLWRSETGEWESDPAKPVGFYGNLMDVAFRPGDPQSGYAVGKGGVILHYDKSWVQDDAPPGFSDAPLTSVAFAGSQALVAAGTDVLQNNGNGWSPDSGVRDALAGVRNADPQITAVAGLPDGGAVAAGRDVALERDGGPGSPWRVADQPLPGATAVAAAAFREDGQVRALISLAPRFPYPRPDVIPPQDPNAPPIVLPPFPISGDGYVVRQTGSGWRDEEHASAAGTSTDRPSKTDPILDFLVGGNGDGWAVGGWSGYGDSAGRGSSGTGAGKIDRDRVQSASIYRYSGGGAPAGPPAAGQRPIPMGGGVVRFAVGGHAQCEEPCAALSQSGLGPDTSLTTALQKVRGLSAQPGGPRMFLYTGARVKLAGNQAMPQAEADRYASLLAGQPGLPVYAAVDATDAGGGKVDAYRAAFGGFNGPFGDTPTPPGMTSVAAGPAGGSARTHYAFDTSGPEGTVRVVVIDNSAGSLAASDPYQNPPEAQKPWLVGVLQDAKARGIASVVMGSRDLSSGFTPRLNTATDADDEAQTIRDNGASAYFYDRPEENRALRIPSGSTDSIPEYGSGTLGYRSQFTGSSQLGRADSLFGDQGYYLAEVDTSARDPATNRAPVTARFIPLIDDLSLNAVDGTELRRSRPALFTGLGRRPQGGDRWGTLDSDGNANPAGGDPYVNFPPALCTVSGCSTRVVPEYQFTSSDPAIADFVKVDPNSNNLRKPLQDQNGRVITDNSSGLLCAFNPGTATLTVSAGGLAYSTQVTVLPGSVQQPCGTRVLNPAPLRTRPTSSPVPSTPPSPAPAKTPLNPIKLPPAPAPLPPAAVPAPPAVREPARPLPHPPPPPPVPLQPVTPAFVPTILPPPTPPIGRPIPPGGAVARVFQVEEKREEELAPEESQAFAAHAPDQGGGVPPAVPILAVLVLALAGAGIVGVGRGRRRYRRVEAAPLAVRRPPNRSRR